MIRINQNNLKKLSSFSFLFVLCFSVFLIKQANAQVKNKYVEERLSEIKIDERLGDVIALDAKFALSNGDSVLIKDLLKAGKPIILNPVYFECPMLCGLVLNGLLKSVGKLDWSPGVEYQIISFSINPLEKHELANQNRLSYLDSLKRESAKNGWYFLTGNDIMIRKLTQSIGFKYFYDEETQQYYHAAVIVIINPDGMITRYLYGIEYESVQLKKALSEAVDGRIGTTVDKILLYCYAFDPNLNSYVPKALNIMKLGGVVIMVCLGFLLGILWFKEKISTK